MQGLSTTERATELSNDIASRFFLLGVKLYDFSQDTHQDLHLVRCD